MADHANGACTIIYFCASASSDLRELYHKTSPPAPPAPADSGRHIYENVRALLDEDLGGFEEVFLCSNPKECLERLDSSASTLPAVVLVELQNATSSGRASPSLLKDSKANAYAFLCALGSDIEGARYQKHVLPFVLLTRDGSSDIEKPVNREVNSSCLRAGAVDVIQSPLRPKDINHLVGHIKDAVRPPAKLIAAQMSQNLVDSIHNYSEPSEPCYRPDLLLSAERQATIVQAIQRWHFPAHEFSMDELTCAALFMLEHILRSPDLEPYGLSRSKLMGFLLATRRMYKHEREVHYHNWRHAVDVTQSLYCFLLDVRLCPREESDERSYRERSAVERLLTPLDGLILLVSAIGHDVGHPGVNNAFLVACNHPLAQTYNDKSVLENYHCAAYSQLLRRHWPALNNITGFRATMISTILATDMQRHFEYMQNLGDLKAKAESSDALVDDWTDKERDHARELIMALLMKAADISNVARPFVISAAWAKILMNEFARQGELEAELDIPTCLFGGPPDKEDILAAAQSQKGFMNLFGHPLFQGISELMPALSCSVRELEKNRNTWDEKIEEESRKRTPPGNEGHITFSSVTKQEVDEATAHHQSEPTAVPGKVPQSPSSPTKRIPTAGKEASPSRHAAHEIRQQMVRGLSLDESQRSSAPYLGSAGIPFSPHGGSSRRSSKDVALDQLQQLTAYTHQSLSPTPSSRRESADAGWQIHQSYPSSRRGSKDESLTTILVTSGGGSPNRRGSPASPGKNSSPGKSNGKRQGAQKQPTTRTSAPSSRSHATSSATANTAPQSPSTQPSSQPSSLVTEDESRTMGRDASIPSTEDPFKVPSNWPNDMDGPHRASPREGTTRELASTPPPLAITSSESSQVVSTNASADTDDTPVPPRKAGDRLREARSRSRLRSLKFWKKKKDVSGADTPTSSPAASP